MTDARDVWAFRDVVARQAPELLREGFTERQTRFLTTVMAHGGVFVERQYCRFAGIAHGQKSHNFVARLTRAGLAREIRPGALHQGRCYHVHHRRLYTRIGQPNNRNRRPMPPGRMVERLMLLDAVLDDPSVTWLGTEADKTVFFNALHRDSPIRPRELPHLAFGEGATATLRLFPDKLPIGVDWVSSRYVFLYLMTRRQPMDFRMFLMRHLPLWRSLPRWTLRVLVPKPLVTVQAAYERAADEDLCRPLSPSDEPDLRWYFEHRRTPAHALAPADQKRLHEAQRRFRGPRFPMLEQAWRERGDSALWYVCSPGIADQVDRGFAAIEFVRLQRQYLHLDHLVGVA